ncbi:hypothetical protein RFI_39828 [Reticulomyxa filosa]|uniref:Uncharacterized protein n=1 Tax=Reticulomyxa filosa TaxID=46433 RepID=X6L8E3_RETFI|nr:hypothetical protein RFI_39828 [Reticulomyxa filosa]|eukprot:ETN97698.1 hypothetical protein RFI_39828 [Reticulomyxa filosa]
MSFFYKTKNNVFQIKKYEIKYHLTNVTVFFIFHTIKSILKYKYMYVEILCLFWKKSKIITYEVQKHCLVQKNKQVQVSVRSQVLSWCRTKKKKKKSRKRVFGICLMKFSAHVNRKESSPSISKPLSGVDAALSLVETKEEKKKRDILWVALLKKEGEEEEEEKEKEEESKGKRAKPDRRESDKAQTKI